MERHKVGTKYRCIIGYYYSSRPLSSGSIPPRGGRSHREPKIYKPSTALEGWEHNSNKILYHSEEIFDRSPLLPSRPVLTHPSSLALPFSNTSFVSLEIIPQYPSLSTARHFFLQILSVSQ